MSMLPADIQSFEEPNAGAFLLWLETFRILLGQGLGATESIGQANHAAETYIAVHKKYSAASKKESTT